MNRRITQNAVAVFLFLFLFAGLASCKTQQTAKKTDYSSIESPQPTLTHKEAASWANEHAGLLIEKYMETSGNKLDPDEMRKLFMPIGYDGGTNTTSYRDAEKVLVDTLYAVMLKKAVTEGNTSIVILTGPSASGKSTAIKSMDLSKKGLVYDAAFNSYKKLSTAVDGAQKAGMKNITVIAVYNTIRNCFSNSINRGKKTNRFIHIPYMIESYGNNVRKLELLKQNYPGINFICIDNSANSGEAKMVSIDEAIKWNFVVSQEDIAFLFNIILDEINQGGLTKHQLTYVTGDILSIEGLSDSNKALAKEIDRRIREMPR